MAPRVLIGDRRAADVAAQNLPYAADHRMAALVIAEEVVHPLAQRRAARVARETVPAAYGEDRPQQPRNRVEAFVRFAIGLHPLRFVELGMFQRYVLRVELVEVPIDDLVIVRVANLILGAREWSHDEERNDVKADFFQGLSGDAATVWTVEGEAEHIAGMHRNPGPMPVVDRALVFVNHVAP